MSSKYIRFADIDDDHKFIRKCQKKLAASIRRNIGYYLTYDDVYNMLKDAGLKSSNWGCKKGQYVIGRYNDTGDYKVGNCRFITTEENSKERKISDLARETSRKTMTNFMKTEKGRESQRRAAIIGGEMSRGELNSNAKITNKESVDIFTSALRPDQLAVKYHLARCTINDIITGRTRGKIILEELFKNAVFPWMYDSRMSADENQEKILMDQLSSF
jgi:hypothetical protein